MINENRRWLKYDGVGEGAPTARTVRELLAIDRLAADARTVREIAALRHEALDHAVKRRALVVQRLAATRHALLA